MGERRRDAFRTMAAIGEAPWGKVRAKAGTGPVKGNLKWKGHNLYEEKSGLERERGKALRRKGISSSTKKEAL